MPIYTVKIKRSISSYNMRFEKSVDVVTHLPCNVIFANEGQLVADAFMRIYGLDIKKAGVLNLSYLEATLK